MGFWDFFINRFKAWKYGQTGITGIGMVRNNAKMVAVLLPPFMVTWLIIQFSVGEGVIPEDMGAWLSLADIIGWMFYCGIYWAWAVTDASKHKCFPQTPISFPDGGVRKMTFPIKVDGIVKRCEWSDGTIGAEFRFLHKYAYQGKDMAFPYVFNKALLRLPAGVGESFDFDSQGEFWHKGMIVETSNCEHVSMHIYGWVRENDEWKPVGSIVDCSLNYRRALDKFSNATELIDMVEADAYFMAWKGAVKREDELQQYTSTLEDAHEVALDQKGRGVKEEVDKNLESIREGVHSITDVKEPIWKRVFKLGNILKVLLVVFIIWGLLKLFGVL